MVSKREKMVFKPIRGSTALLLFKLIFFLVIVDTAHSLLSIVVFELPLLENFHPNLALVMFISHIIKNIFEVYVVLSIVLYWINNTYYLTEQHIIHKEGTFNIREKLYDLKIIRAVTVNQSFMGKILNYGDIVITTSASGGYNDNIYMIAIGQPEKYKDMLKHCLEVAIQY